MTVAPYQHPESNVEQTASPSRPFFARRVGAFLRRIPPYSYAGAALNIVAWVSSWGRIGPWWMYTFFPLWFGFILFLDGLNVARSGTSLLKRSLPRFAALFLFSMPLWWAFEGFNIPVQNWHYLFDHHYSPLAYFVVCSIDFSTVLPVVMEVAELLASFGLLRPRLGPSEVGPRAPTWQLVLFLALGVVMFVLPVLFPQYAFPLIWLVLIFLLDPINNLFRRKSVLGHLHAGDWRFLLTVPLAALICGFFWEMWNYFAMPKWYYTVPFFDQFPHYFEMPIPGLTGYLPFGLELFAMYQFLLLILSMRKDNLAI